MEEVKKIKGGRAIHFFMGKEGDESEKGVVPTSLTMSGQESAGHATVEDN